MEELIKFENFTKNFKYSKVGPISFNIKPGRIIGLLGSSGSGKTVILNSLTGIIKKFKGSIEINKINRKSQNYYKSNREIGYYTQMDFSLYDISAYKFLIDICMIFGIKKTEIAKTVEKWMVFFDLWESKDKKLKNFSWGMKNRINFIICFIKNPTLIILDEPGANLDSIWRNKIKNLLIKYKNEGKTIVITVHNIDEMADIIDDYVILDAGMKVFEGSKEELNIYSKYKIYLKEFFDVQNFRDFLLEKNIKSFKYDKEENSLVIAIDKYQQLNFLFLYLIKNNLPLKNLVKLPINMESIYKALEDKEKID
ncbi:ABC transporter ATP-binding protein [Spiroplasma culicicola]|uniref:ABC transporter ATP-binding protein n=1 Tax=Spiroplasma culicicola AES-1 TaxID=1276246 RepID=W6A7M6_9MOLU|nr:ABC transporter ATP-binding protein [Spiroplasma culicicola]AHI52986.1 ABC transporter ATP-binding protein [Spiroplasma culicicola AES-1]